MFYTIYRITNNINGKTYIGKHQTKDLQDGYMGSGKLIKRAIKAHGIENFTKEILHVFDTEEEMNQAEKNLVVIGEESYNLCEGGKGGWGYLNDHSVSHIKRTRKGYQKSQTSMVDPIKNRRNGMKARELQLGVFGISPEQKSINSAKAFLGKKHSVETKKLLSDIQKNIDRTKNNNPMFGKKWMNDGHKNFLVSSDQFDEFISKGFEPKRKMKLF